ncbi:MAG TPA: SdrD B-like domain-containing protein, partial [Anaerolineae bacterium]|nr:SdrD B-like domain-containing protein [Anaerolineae bacterium]
GAALPGTVQTGDPDNTCPSAGCDNRHTVNLATDEQYLEADFGYQPTGAGVIGDTVFEDIGNDGVFTNLTDFGIPGVTVELYEDTDGDGVITPGVDALVATDVTDANGTYSFSGLAEGFDYIVYVDPVDPALTTYFGANPYQASTPIPQPVPNLAGTYNDADFGFWQVEPGSIGDQVFIDNDGDSLYDPLVDTPLAGVTVDLYRDGVLVATTVSGPDGTYLFDNLGPGTYTVVVDTNDPDLPGGLFATVEDYDVTLVAGQDYLDADFPFVSGLTKTVDLSYATAGQTLNFTLKPTYPGNDLLENVRIIDPLPAGTTYVAASANAGGTYGAYTPLPAAPGQDTAGGPAGTTTLDTAITVSTNFVNVGGSVNVTLNVKQNSGAFVNSVTPTELSINGGAATCTGPTPASANVPTGAVGQNFVWSCTLTEIGEYTFSAGAENDVATYSWPEATSASVLSAPGGGPNVVTWNLGSNVPGVPGETITSGRTAGVFGLAGANKKDFSKYGVNSNAWTALSQPTNGIEKGGSLTTDGAGTIWALEGNSKIFYRYNIVTGAWTPATGGGSLAQTSDNANEGGALQYLNVGGTEYVFALLGNSNRFRRYAVAGNSWSNMVNTPATVKKGGALTTDGTYIYALQGDTKKGFWRCNATTNNVAGACSGASGSWTTLANTPENVGWGGALTYVGGYIYALRGDGKTNFWRYDIAANTWSSMAPALGNVGDGGALATNGSTYIYALQGKTKAFWRYDISANQWTTVAPANFANSVGQGGALAYDPGDNPQGLATNLVATPSLVATGDQITLVMRFQSSTAVNDVVPGALAVTPTGGASCSATAGPTLLSADDDLANINDEVRYQWICTVAAPTTTPASLKFSTGGTGASPATTFPVATSRSVLVSPLLTFQATVNTPAPTSGLIENTGLLVKAGPEPNAFPSNTTQTATSGSIGDFVWNDADGDGVQDAGELGLAGVEVCVYESDGVTLVDCAVTDANGAYRIFGLPAGDYVVRTDPATYPAGFIPTTPPELDVTLGNGVQYNNADFGLTPPGAGSIGDYIWLDANDDGVQDAAEAGLPGIT